MTILLGIGTGLATSRRANVNNSTPTFAPDQLFTGGTKGAWYDPSDLSTMFQDTTMAVPVAAHNDPVRVIKDKSGNSNHLVSPSDEARPIYQTDGTRKWLVFVDGDKWLRSDIIGIAATTSDNIYIAAASDNNSSSGAWAPITFGQGPTSNIFFLSYRTKFGYTDYYGTIRDTSNKIYSISKSNVIVNERIHYQDFYIPAGTHPSNPPVTVSCQIDGVSALQSINDGPEPFIISARIGIGTFDFSNPVSNESNSWYGGIVVLRAVTQIDRDNLRTFFSTPH